MVRSIVCSKFVNPPRVCAGEAGVDPAGGESGSGQRNPGGGRQ